MALIVDIRPTTELDAINVMLGAIGEMPLPADADLEALETSDANVEAAVGILRETTREVLTAGWRFNTLTGLEVLPTGTVEWPDTAGNTTTLNVFKVPEETLAWSQTPCLPMQALDLVERRALRYEEAGEKPLILFDRVWNRDGATVPAVYLDVVTSCDFLDMPEAARRFATVVAGRRLTQRLPASELQAAFTRDDERAALRVLKREQGITRKANLFNTATAFEISGRRPRIGGGYFARVFPGGA